MPEYEEGYGKEEPASRKEAPEVYSFSGERKGSFDTTHVIGSATEYGISADKAVDHGMRVRNIVELVGEPIVMTDSIRYILDGLRNKEPGAPASDKELRGFRDHIRENAGRLKERMDRDGKSLAVDREFGDLAEYSPKLSKEEKENLYDIILRHDPSMFTPYREKDCSYRLLSRETKKYTEIYPHFENIKVTSVPFTEERKTEITRNLKLILKHSLSSSITLETLGITSTAGVDSEATMTELEQTVQTSSWWLILFTVIMTIRIRARRRFDVTEKWGMAGEDCPLKSQVPDVKNYTIYGDWKTFRFQQTFQDWSLGVDKATAMKYEDRMEGLGKRDFLRRLRETQGRWMPELPFPDDYEPDVP